MRILTFAAALLLAGTASAQHRTTELEARSYIASAFMTGVAQAILANDVGVDSLLRQRLALPTDASRERIYQAICALTEDKAISVRKATAEEASALAGRSLGRPVFTVEGAAVPLVMVYDLDRNAIPYVALPGTRAAAVGATGAVPTQPKAVRVADAGAAPPAPAVPTVMRLKPIVFGFDDAALSADARAELQREGLPKIVEIREVRYVVQGHADRLGSPEHNQRLSERRAEAVRDYLVERGVAPEYIEVVALGASLPQTSCEERDLSALIACLAPDRRVTVEIQPPPM